MTEIFNNSLFVEHPDSIFNELAWLNSMRAAGNLHEYHTIPKAKSKTLSRVIVND